MGDKPRPLDADLDQIPCGPPINSPACLHSLSVIISAPMKQFVIDELRPGDHEKLKTYLDYTFGAGALDGLYWLQIAKDVFSDIQSEHKQCQPFYFAIDLGSDRVVVELLVRTKSRIRCACMAYATETQCTWLMRRMDAIFSELGITV